MTHQPRKCQSTPRGKWIILASSLGLFVAFALGLSAQENVGVPKAAPDAARALPDLPRNSIEVSGYTRPGNPDDKISPDGKIIPAGFAAQGVQKFKIMGGTVYFAVFRNIGAVDGDTFSTGMTNIDQRFQEGRSFNNSFSPRYDRRAKYLYLYQVVNDRGLDPRQSPVPEKKKGDIALPVVAGASATNKLPETDDLASFALKLLVDPRYVTSWGHFSNAGFAANVRDVTAEQLIKQVAFGDEAAVKAPEIRLAVSYNPAIEAAINQPAFSTRARAFGLGALSGGFGVDAGTLNLKNSKGGQEIKRVSGELSKDGIKLARHVEGRLKANEATNEPDFVQMMYLASEERAPTNAKEVDEDITRAIFRVDWRQGNVLKQGEHSVVFGFTTDLPPVNAPIRIDTPTAAVRSEGMRLANYFADPGGANRAGAGAAPGGGDPGIVPVAVGAEAAALALGMGTALGQAPTPVPPPGGAPGGGAGGFAGIAGAGGVGGGGGGAPVGGGIGFPALGGGGFSRPGGGAFGGGGTQGGGGTTGGGTNPNTSTTTTTPGTSGTTINFTQTLTNQQQQQQNQGQSQSQHNDGGGHGSGHGGHVVPAPASLLLGLLGLPALFFLRRRKID